MTEEDIGHLVGILKEALSVPAAHFRVGEILGLFEAECKSVLSLFKEVPPGDIHVLSDANETIWLGRYYSHYAPPFGEAIRALAAVFSLKEAFARRDSYADDFCFWAPEEAESLGDLLRLMRLGYLETKTTKTHLCLAVGQKHPKKAEAIWDVYCHFLRQEPILSHEALVKKIIAEVKKQDPLELAFDKIDKTYHVFLGSSPEDGPFKQKDLDSDKEMSPKKSTLYRHYYLPIQKNLQHKKD